MGNSARTTVYLNPGVYRALKLKSAESDRTLSDIVNQAALELLREDSHYATPVLSVLRLR